MSTPAEEKHEDAKGEKRPDTAPQSVPNVPEIKVEGPSHKSGDSPAKQDSKDVTQLQPNSQDPPPADPVSSQTRPVDIVEKDAEIRLAGRRRKHSEPGQVQQGSEPQEESKESPGLGASTGSGQTQAETAAKVPGRWSPEEHKRFIEGKIEWITAQH